MSLTKVQSKLTKDDMLNYRKIFNFYESEPKNSEESELIDSKDNGNEIKNENINDAKEEIIINNDNDNDNKPETSLEENNLSNSEIKNYIFFKSNNIKKKIFITQHINESNNINKNNSSLKNKRGRTKKSDDQREHTKFDKDNIKKKIDGIIINSLTSFINKKIEKIDAQSEKLKKLSFKETINLKSNMCKTVKDICQNISTSYKEDHNKNVISTYELKLKEIFEMPLYKTIHHISGKHIGILKDLEKTYLDLKNKKLKKENENYKKMFKEIEYIYLDSIKAKYPIIDEITQDDALHSHNNVEKNFKSIDNNEMNEEIQSSLRMDDGFNNNTINDLDLSGIIPRDPSNIDMDEILFFSEPKEALLI
jgi:hypothetical protein